MITHCKEIVFHDFQKEVLCLDQELSPYQWTPEQWKQLSSDEFLYGALKDSELAGFCLMRYSKWESMLHLLKIVVHPNYRGLGVSKELFVYAAMRSKKEVERVYLEVASDNAAAIQFYRKLGFQELRISPKYYSDGKDAMMMELKVS